MKIIDFAVKGNSVRFYLGKDDCTDYTGDDWNDVPYEHNAGKVYDEYIKGQADISFDFDDIVLEPCSGKINSIWSKDDMKKRKIPCIVVISKDLWNQEWKTKKVDSIFSDFCYWISKNDKGIKKYYFGDLI